MTEKVKAYQIYKEAFGEDDFSLQLFSKYFEFCKVLKNGENVVAITFLFPCEILTEKKTYNALYLFAVATDTKYRNKGYMTKLLENIKKEDSDKILFLKPSNDGLIKFYEKQGFYTVKAKSSREGKKRVVLGKALYNLSKGESEANNSIYDLMCFYTEKIDLNGISFADTME